jgi:hypothetical protein
MTAILFVLLLFSGIGVYDSLLTAFATAGTGGFAPHGASIAYYDSIYVETVVAIFMFLFGINFNIYYFILIGSVTKIFTPLQIGKRAQLQESYMMRQVYEGSKGGSVSKIVSVERNDLFRGRCWRIPITSNPKIKLKLHDELKRCGYDNKSIFPIDDLLKDKNKSWKELKDECNAILDKGISI